MHDIPLLELPEVFGFDIQGNTFDFHCGVQKPHGLDRAFEDFASRLECFFSGQYATRRSFYRYQVIRESLQPAALINMNNFVMRPDALAYFFPFSWVNASLSGAFLGSILKKEMGNAFVSANIPLLHNAGCEQTGVTEKGHLKGACEKQFFGDVLLASLLKLQELSNLDEAQQSDIDSVLMHSQLDMQHRYQTRQQIIKRQLEILETLLFAKDAWWNDDDNLVNSRQKFKQFLQTLKLNFLKDDSVLQALVDGDKRLQWFNKLNKALLSYPQDIKRWRHSLAEKRD